MSVSVTTVRALVAELSQRGCAHSDLFDTVGLSLDVLMDAQGWIDRTLYHRLVKLAYERSGDLSLGLTAGMRTPITALSVVGPLMLSASTMRDAFSAFVRYLPLLNHGTRWDLREAQEVAVLSYVPAHPRGPGTRFCTEYALAMACRIGRGGALNPGSQKSGVKVRFSHSAPPQTDRYTSFFGGSVEFGADENAIVLPRSRVDQPRLHADEQIRSAFEQTAERYLTAVDGSSTEARIRAFLRGQHHLHGLSSAVAAERLNQSPRTLRRHLEFEQTTFSRILDEVRAERAREEMSMPEPVLKEVAFRLGLTVPGFHRAFRRWTGQTPAGYARARDARQCPTARTAQV